MWNDQHQNPHIPPLYIEIITTAFLISCVRLFTYILSDRYVCNQTLDTGKAVVLFYNILFLKH
ncbi:hypothetical protein D5278_19350 [bacterium 1XD21-13]|nr:hypothetical protein [bacterium 1XD21-13]